MSCFEIDQNPRLVQAEPRDQITHLHESKPSNKRANEKDKEYSRKHRLKKKASIKNKEERLKTLQATNEALLKKKSELENVRELLSLYASSVNGSRENSNFVDILRQKTFTPDISYGQGLEQGPGVTSLAHCSESEFNIPNFFEGETKYPIQAGEKNRNNKVIDESQDNAFGASNLNKQGPSTQELAKSIGINLNTVYDETFNKIDPIARGDSNMLQNEPTLKNEFLQTSVEQQTIQSDDLNLDIDLFGMDPSFNELIDSVLNNDSVEPNNQPLNRLNQENEVCANISGYQRNPSQMSAPAEDDHNAFDGLIPADQQCFPEPLYDLDNISFSASLFQEQIDQTRTTQEAVFIYTQAGTYQANQDFYYDQLPLLTNTPINNDTLYGYSNTHVQINPFDVSLDLQHGIQNSPQQFTYYNNSVFNDHQVNAASMPSNFTMSNSMVMSSANAQFYPSDMSSNFQYVSPNSQQQPTSYSEYHFSPVSFSNELDLSNSLFDVDLVDIPNTPESLNFLKIR